MNSIDDRIKNLSPQKRALLERQLEQSKAAAVREPIAIVGIGCRYPGGVHDLASFGRLLDGGVDAVGDVPADRWDVDAHYAPDPSAKGKMVTKRGGFLPDVKTFDADFFGISPREAESMDPQQRLLLEVSYEAFEDAGIPTTSLGGSSTGVYVGITLSEYAARVAEDPRALDVYSGTGSYLNVAAGRLSYVYGLQGPCMAVDAACASSLVSVHLALQALRNRECHLALAGGVSLMLAPETTIYLSQTGALSPDGRCKTFDARANGYVRAEGCGLLVLKRLSDALRDRDRIHALLRGSAVSQDGASSGLTVPNGRAQQKVILAALKDAAVRSEDVSYVEAHGTGTPLGDPIELHAIQAAYAASPLYVGSLKTNFGHAEAAAGVGGIIKTVIALREKRIPRHLHFEKLNPVIAIDPARVVIPTAPVPWSVAADRKRLAGVSSFGFSGIIAHAVLEEAPPAPVDTVPSPSVGVLPVTAKHPRALGALLASVRASVAALDEARLPDVSFTACRRRTHHGQRAWFAFRNKEELLQQLDAAARGHALPGAVLLGREARDGVKVAMVFPGQGSQWVGMGQQLMKSSAAFREAIHEVERAFRPWANFSLLEVLDAKPGTDPFTEVSVVQPTLFAVQVALAKHWEAWGIRPHAVIGHSMGEVAAAYVAGALRLEDAAAVICRRSQRVQATRGRGAMALVESSAAEAAEVLAPYGDALSLAAYNGPSTVLVSGEPSAMDALLATLDARGVFCRKVKVDYASHCAQMAPLLDGIRADLAHVRPQRGHVPIYSTARGAILDGAQLDAEYWAENLRRPVLFHERLEALLADGVQAFLEISPHPVLLPAIQKTIDAFEGEGPVALPSLRRDEDEVASLATSLGSLFAMGHAVDFSHVCPPAGTLVDGPSYPWQRREFWLSKSRPRRRAEGHPLLGTAFRPAAGPEAHYWEFDVDEDGLAFVTDHRVRGMTVLPGTAYLDFALSAAKSVWGLGAVSLADVSFREALTLLPGQPRRMQLGLVCGDGVQGTLASRDASAADEWTVHATFRVQVHESAHAERTVFVVPPAGAVLRDGKTHYRLMNEGGLGYGPRFQGLAEVHLAPGEAWGRLRASEELDPEAHVFHPASWDAAHQAVAALLTQSEHASHTWIPLGIEHATVFDAAGTAAWVRATAEVVEDGTTARGNVLVLDASGRVLVETRGLTLLRRDADGLDDVGQWFFEPSLREVPLAGEGTAEAGAWAVLGAADALHAQVVAHLKERGARVVDSAKEPSLGVIDLRPFQRADAPLSELYLEAVQQARLLQGTEGREPKLVLVTAAGSLAAASLQGVGRVIATELPRLRCVRIELSGPEDTKALVRELYAGDDEDEIVLREGKRFVRRLARASSAAAKGAAIHGDGAYLLTGGLGGLGLTFADWLVDRGARTLVLVGRRAASPDAEARIEGLRARGAEVWVRQVDMAQADAVTGLFREMDGALPPLRGVLHMAGVLDDATLYQQDARRFASVAGPKVVGTQLLHEHTRHRSLDFFVLFSAGAALLGAAGQANYAAANAFMDALAVQRREAGLPALSINWGIWDEVGLAASSAQRGQRLQEQGLVSISPALGLQAFERALSQTRPNLAILPIRLARWFAHHPEMARASLFKDLVRGALQAGAEAEVPILERLRAMTDAREQREALRHWVQSQMAAVLRRDPASMDRQQNFSAMGVDSLMALEFRNRLERALGVRLPPTMVFNHPNLDALGGFMETKLSLVAPAEAAPAEVAPPAPRIDAHDGAALLGALSRLKRLKPPSPRNQADVDAE
ncbi:SDR family NAD(P)-dependent oxidoreductase [Pendulispora rubella]|uniref:SDR family NAD(P)-dependent oxidoreductase n=1 Tax=Pendulispora rubella TaxID=2741070 RepID=A0ABZ2KZ39_9BACT